MFDLNDMVRQRQNSRDFDKAVNSVQAENDQLATALLAEKKASRDLAHALAIQKAHADALMSQLAAMIAEHGDSKLLQHTGRIKRNGKPETVLGRDFYNPVFDASARKAGINTPDKIRA